MKLLLRQKENKNSFKLFKLLFPKADEINVKSNVVEEKVETSPNQYNTDVYTDKSMFERNILRYSVGSFIRIGGYNYRIEKIPNISGDKYIPFFLLEKNGFIKKLGYTRGYFL